MGVHILLLITSFCEDLTGHGANPKFGWVAPQKLTNGVSSNDAACINPVSPLTTKAAFLIKDNPEAIEYEVASIKWSNWAQSSWANFWSPGPPNNTIGFPSNAIFEMSSCH
tara:strand:+ start:1513 stop:1845 length:333 start_codon:yes stop_codon:yes gene_type:complete